MYFTPEDFFYVFIRLLSQVFIRDAPGISEKDENRSKSTKVTKVTDAGASMTSNRRYTSDRRQHQSSGNIAQYRLNGV